MALAWKAGWVQALAGSNPASSAALTRGNSVRTRSMSTARDALVSVLVSVRFCQRRAGQSWRTAANVGRRSWTRCGPRSAWCTLHKRVGWRPVPFATVPQRSRLGQPPVGASMKMRNSRARPDPQRLIASTAAEVVYGRCQFTVQVASAAGPTPELQVGVSSAVLHDRARAKGIGS